MDDGEKLLLVLKLWLVLVPVIITVSNSKLVSSCDEMFEPDTFGFISIDCGATADYEDDETGLPYVSDKKCMDTGEIHEISPNLEARESHRQQRKYLRSFPQGTRNCYTLKLKQGENNKYLIRAIFEYGNYDLKSQTPIFDLYFGVNRLLTMDVDLDFHEIIHVSSMEYVDICLVNINRGVPYITALELRPLDNSTYQTQNGALIAKTRYDVGRTAKFRQPNLRYPNDAYDRLWFLFNSDEWNVTSTEFNISIDEYKVPEVVMQTAVTTKNADILLNLYFDPPSFGSQCYVFFYFAETEKLEGKRELIIDFNGEGNHSESVKLDYLEATTIIQKGPLISASRLNFSISSVKGSSVPPILNAYEVYVFRELPNSPTNLDDGISYFFYASSLSASFYKLIMVVVISLAIIPT